MPDVPQFKKPMSSLPDNRAIYCFRPGASEADKQHDIAEVEKFVEYVKAKRKDKLKRKSQ
jgi:hypothetical protein